MIHSERDENGHPVSYATVTYSLVIFEPLNMTLCLGIGSNAFYQEPSSLASGLALSGPRSSH